MKTVIYFLVALISGSICASAGAENRDAHKVVQAPRVVGAIQKTTCLTPAIDSLTMQSDFSIFLLPSCPTEVRTNALRKLWRVLPQTSETEQMF